MAHAISEALLVDIIARYIVPLLTDVTQLPDASWPGWERVLGPLQVDRNDAATVADVIARCQNVLQQVLQTLMSVPAPGMAFYTPGADSQQVQPQQQTDGQAAVNSGSAGGVPGTGTEGQITASQLQLTELVGSAGDQQVLLNQPRASILARAKLPRGDRVEYWYQLAFEGYSETDAEWFPANRIRSEYPNGRELLENFERGLEESGQQDADMPPEAVNAASAHAIADSQLPAPAPLALAPMSDTAAAGMMASGGMAAAPMGDAAGMQLHFADTVGNKRPREEGDAAEDELSKRQRADEEAAAAAAAAMTDPMAAAAATAAAAAADPMAAAAAAGAAAEAATSAGMAAQLGAGGQLFAMAGADGQPMLQVVPLQVDSQLGQMQQLDLSQFANLDPQTLQALSLQGMQVNPMGQLVLHMPGGHGGSHPMLTTAGLQLAAMPGLGMAPAPVQHAPGREHIIAHVKEAIKLLMHSSEELQRKKRQQTRRSELNQRRALLLPDGSAAPGALPTTAAGTPAPPPVRPTNMLAAIQALPPAEKRNMLITALRRALPIMMQTAQVGGSSSSGMISRHHQDAAAAMAAAAAAASGGDEAAMALQYQQLLAAGGQPGMQIIAVPLQNGMQGLMQVPLTAEQLQSMGQGAPITLDANGQLQLPAGMMLADPNAMAAAAANPAMLASMGMLTAEQLQQLGLQAADGSAVAGLDAASLAAAGITVSGPDGTAQAIQLPADAAAALLAGQDPNAAGGQLQYDPATAAAIAAAAAAAAAATGAPGDASMVQTTIAPDGSILPAVSAAADPADHAAQQAAMDAAAAGNVVSSSMPVFGLDLSGALPPLNQAADGQVTVSAAPAAVVVGAGAASADAGAASGGAAKQDDAILAAISLTNLSRMPGPDEDNGAADGAAADSAAAGSGAAADVSQQVPSSVVMQETAAVSEMPAATEQHVDAGAAAAAQMAMQHLEQNMGNHQQIHFMQPDQMQLHEHAGEKFHMQLPPHLSGIQQVLDMNPELLTAHLATQDFTAPGMH